MKVGLGLGSNFGDRLRHLQDARAFLAGLAEDGFARSSPVYESAPVDCPPGSGPFLNAVIEIEYAGTPRELLSATQVYERAQGRERTERNAPRTIDIDILYFGDRRVQEPDLVIPHPRLQERRFVLEPLRALRPDWPALPAGAGQVKLMRDDW